MALWITQAVIIITNQLNTRYISKSNFMLSSQDQVQLVVLCWTWCLVFWYFYIFFDWFLHYMYSVSTNRLDWCLHYAVSTNRLRVISVDEIRWQKIKWFGSMYLSSFVGVAIGFLICVHFLLRDLDKTEHAWGCFTILRYDYNLLISSHYFATKHFEHSSDKFANVLILCCKKYIPIRVGVSSLRYWPLININITDMFQWNLVRFPYI